MTKRKKKRQRIFKYEKIIHGKHKPSVASSPKGRKLASINILRQHQNIEVHGYGVDEIKTLIHKLFVNRSGIFGNIDILNDCPQWRN